MKRAKDISLLELAIAVAILAVAGVLSRPYPAFQRNSHRLRTHPSVLREASLAHEPKMNRETSYVHPGGALGGEPPKIRSFHD
jgi:Tfp pilus assembly protein PilE